MPAHRKSAPRRRLTRGVALDDDERRTPMVRAVAVVAGIVLLVAGTGGSGSVHADPRPVESGGAARRAASAVSGIGGRGISRRPPK